MRTRARLLLCVLVGCVAGNIAVAQGWRIHEGVEASVRNRAGNSSLLIQCIQDGRIFMRVQFHAYTNIWMNEKAVVRIGTKSFPVEIGIGNDFMYLSNAPESAISTELIDALKGGGMLVLEGPAVGRLSEAQRSFPLDGGGKLIEEVQKDCGRRQ